LRFYKKNQSVNGDNKTYAQASKNNIDDIIKIKDAFPKLLIKKIIEIHNMMNNKEKKIKLRINIITKMLELQKVGLGFYFFFISFSFDLFFYLGARVRS